MSFAVVVCGRNRRWPTVIHEKIDSAIKEASRLRLLENNLDRTTWIVEIKAVLPAEVPKSGTEKSVQV